MKAHRNVKCEANGSLGLRWFQHCCHAKVSNKSQQWVWLHSVSSSRTFPLSGLQSSHNTLESIFGQFMYLCVRSQRYRNNWMAMATAYGYLMTKHQHLVSELHPSLPVSPFLIVSRDEGRYVIRFQFVSMLFSVSTADRTAHGTTSTI